MRTFARRSSAIAVAGILAFAGAACGDDAEDTGADVDVTEPAEDDTTVEEETTTEVETTEDTEMTESEDMGSEMETDTEMTESETE